MRSEDRERAAADGHQGPGSSGSNEPRSPCVGAGAGRGGGSRHVPGAGHLNAD